MEDHEPVTDPKLAAFKLVAQSRFDKFERRIRLVATALGIVTGCLTLLGILVGIGARVARADDAGIRVEAVKSELDTHKAASELAHGQLREEAQETRVDIRALYRAVLSGRPQARLERQLDGGTP